VDVTPLSKAYPALHFHYDSWMSRRGRCFNIASTLGNVKIDECAGMKIGRRNCISTCWLVCVRSYSMIIDEGKSHNAMLYFDDKISGKVSLCKRVPTISSCDYEVLCETWIQLYCYFGYVYYDAFFGGESSAPVNQAFLHCSVLVYGIIVWNLSKSLIWIGIDIIQRSAHIWAR
jgi:hypothetical protein